MVERETAAPFLPHLGSYLTLCRGMNGLTYLCSPQTSVIKLWEAVVDETSGIGGVNSERPTFLGCHKARKRVFTVWVGEVLEST